MPAPKKDEKKENKINKEGDQARLIIDLPQDAKLYVDDHLMKTTSAHRTFRTPALEQGQTYYYILRVEVVRDGKTYQDSKRVTLKAGDEIRAAFTSVETAATAKADR